MLLAFVCKFPKGTEEDVPGGSSDFFVVVDCRYECGDLIKYLFGFIYFRPCAPPVWNHADPSN